MTRNPYQTSLVVGGGICVVLAYMFAGVLSEMTDYEMYDVADAEAISVWMYLLIGTGAVMLVGAVVIAGVDWTLDHRNDANRQRVADTTRTREFVSAGSDNAAR